MADSPAQHASSGAPPSCPICKRTTSFAVENRYRPFCSARCQQVDLSNWLDERYVVPGAHAPLSETADESATPIVPSPAIEQE